MSIELTDKITVRLIQSMGGDAMVVASAKVSTSGEDALRFTDPALADDNAGLINYLVKMRHGTPFEHSALTFFVHAPAFVWWEWVRHRVGQTVDCPDLSFNLESGRYRRLEPVFWAPSPDRPMMIPATGYSPARPHFDPAEPHEYATVQDSLATGYRIAWDAYQRLVYVGVANEVARAVLGFGIYYSGWVTCNARSLMNFLSLRTHERSAKFVSYPQAEIEVAARAAEQFLSEGWPLSHKAFCANGRVGP